MPLLLENPIDPSEDGSPCPPVPAPAALPPRGPGEVVPLRRDLRALDEAPSAAPPRPALVKSRVCRAVQRALGLIETAVLPTAAAGSPDRPVFVTGLPGGGAGRAFRLLAGGGHYACHHEGSGAFVAAPRLEGLVRRALRRPPDNPAALDEALWLAAYGAVPEQDLGAAARQAAEARLRSLVARLCAVRDRSRYLGKNAGLMTRLGALRETFPDARIVVAFRDPAAQLAGCPVGDAATRADGLRYWIDAHRRAAAADGVVLLDTDRLAAEGRPILRRLAQATDTPETDALLAQLPPPGVGGAPQARAAPDAAHPVLLAEARALHWRLARAAI